MGGRRVEKNVKLSVRQLVEFVLRGGSIDNRSGGMDRAQEGSRIHRRIQKAGGEYYQAEVFFRHTQEYEGIAFTVEGRADGIITQEETAAVDEIKTTRLDLAAIEEDYNRLHWAQAMCYAYFYALQNDRERMDVQLTYVHVGEFGDPDGTKRFIRTFTAEELAAAYEDLLARYKKWADFSCEWAEKRNASIAALPFPFPSYRRGQRSLAVTTYRTIVEEGTAFCQAPTGIGKTISTLFPSVKAMGEGYIAKIFYLTAKTITRQVAEEAFAHMRESGLALKTVTLTAKDKICFLDETACNPEQCPYADGHYDRVNDVLFALLQSEDHMTRERIEQAARQGRVCPFELALDLSLWCDGVICDYNYLFDPMMYLKRFFAEGRGEYAFLIDEAHNLVDRAREMYSAGLEKAMFLELKRRIASQDKAMSRALGAVNEEFIALRKQCGDQRYVEQLLPPDELGRALVRFTEECEGFFKRHPDSPDEPDLLQLYFDALLYLKILELYDEKYLTAVEAWGSEVTVKLCCLDPSGLIRAALDRGRAAVFFSATLTPLTYFSAVLGGDEDSRRLALPSPFERDHLKLLVADRVSTRYRDREASLRPIAELIARTVQAKTGNYMVYFPSYQYMNEVYEAFSSLYPGVDTLLQQSGMSEEEREAFLARFDRTNAQTLVGFCVLGGIYSEGIDLKGDRLIGTVVVGVGLPQIGREQNRIRDYYNRNGGTGYEFAYQYPGMNKVLQAAGRVIRGEEDRGVVVLVDDRFASPAYLRLFPEHWHGCRLVHTPEALEREIREFWQGQEDGGIGG
ncbi:MAG TPA: ATP-dependent DNA helicase [Firmicutes bacterium]|nr:ATP-dependent DNA helicase [Bacillota bacterium]